MPKLLIYLLIAILMVSCEKQQDWALQPSDNDFLVVDGIITSELKFQTIKLSKPVSELNGAPLPVSGATVLVSTDQSNLTFKEMATEPGTYRSLVPFIGSKNKVYSLLINSGDEVYTAKAALAPAVSVFDFVNYQLNEKENRYHFTRTPFPYSPVLPGMYEIELDWSGAEGYEGQNPDSCRAKVYYYTLPTIDVSEVFAPGMESVTFPPGTVITERRYSLSSEHASFLRAVLLETTWQGGYFNTASANIPTNMSSGARGFFGACGVSEKTQTAK